MDDRSPLLEKPDASSRPDDGFTEAGTWIAGRFVTDEEKRALDSEGWTVEGWAVVLACAVAGMAVELLLGPTSTGVLAALGLMVLALAGALTRLVLFILKAGGFPLSQFYPPVRPWRNRVLGTLRAAMEFAALSITVFAAACVISACKAVDWAAFSDYQALGRVAMIMGAKEAEQH